VLRAGVERSQRRIAVLTGETPGALAPLLLAPAPIPIPPLEIAVGVPAQTLLHRPDVRRAERQLAAQTARVGSAQSDAYPSVALIGSIGLDALTGSDFFSDPGRSTSIGGSLSQVIFDFGRIRATVETEDALREQALARFQSAVLLGLEEAENALVDYAREQERRSALADAAGAADRAATLSRDQYTSGLVDFEAVVVAERSRVSLQDQLAVSEAQVTSNLIRLYKALGGGWTPGSGG
jgi:outer membrane protein TolC